MIFTPEELHAHYPRPDRPGVRANFIASADGAATREGRSGSLGDAADRRMFELLRREADVVLVGAGTLRDEGYGGFRLDDASAAWRVGAGMPAHPVTPTAMTAARQARRRGRGTRPR